MELESGQTAPGNHNIEVWEVAYGAAGRARDLRGYLVLFQFTELTMHVHVASAVAFHEGLRVP